MFRKLGKQNLIIVLSVLLVALVALLPLLAAPGLSAKVPEHSAYVERNTPPEALEYSRQFIALVQTRNLEEAERHFVPEVITPDLPAAFEKLAGLLSSAPPDSIKTIGLDRFNREGVPGLTLTYEYQYPGRSSLVIITLREVEAGYRVEGINIQPLEADLASRTAFKFSGQTPLHYAVFAFALALLAFDLYVLALCIKTPGLKRKWLWIIFILIGVGQLDFNWLSGVFPLFAGGQFHLQLFRFPVIGFSQALYKPMMIEMALPVGAIAFLYKRRQWRRKAMSNAN